MWALFVHAPAIFRLFHPHSWRYILKKLLIYLRDYKKETILGPLFKLLEVVFELLVPLVIAKIIDVGIANTDRSYIIRMCLLLVGLGAVGLTSSITAQYYAAKASAGFAKQLKHALFAHIQSLSFSELDTLGTATMITRMTSDMNQVQSGVNMTIRLLLRSPIVVFGAMIMAFTVDTRAALVFAVTIPVLFAVILALLIVCIPLYKRVQSALDRVLSSTRENLAGVRVIRAFCKENDEIEAFSLRHGALTRLQLHAGNLSALLNPLTYVIINLAILFLIQTGAIEVNGGRITQGAVVALYNYMSQILVELIKFANLIITLTKSVACGNRIQDVFEIRPTLLSPAETQTPGDSPLAVEFRQVGLRYRNSASDSLTGLTFAIRRGETIGIIGGTGSGKSSLVQLIPRFYDATEGEVLVDGLNVRNYGLTDLRDRIGMVPQQAVLFQGTLRENMQWGNLAATDEEIWEALTVAQAKAVAEGKGGLDFLIEQGGRNLSGGQMQRFTIARALVRQPELLILDDSASALDFATDAALRQAIRAMPRHPTVFIISQRTSAIRYADQILVMDEGRIVAIGTHDKLLQFCQVYREIYDSQNRKESVADEQTKQAAKI